MNITANKLVLGVPWYGYDYPCLNITNVSELSLIQFSVTNVW